MLTDPDWWSLPAVQLEGWTAGRVYQGPVESSNRPTLACVGQLGESAGSRSHSRSSRLSPSRGRDSREERRCARSWSLGLRFRSTGRSRSLV